MKRVSFWALHHITAARILIVACYLFLNVLGWISGALLFSLNVILPPLFFYLITLIVIITVLIYPFKKLKTPQKFYARKKMADFLLITATFLFIAYSSNSSNINRSVNPLNTAFAFNPVKSIASNKVHNTNPLSKKKAYHESRKSYKKYLRSVVRSARKKYRDSTPAQRILLISLVVIAAIFLIFLVSALACNIICSGAEALGYIILILGIGAIIFGVVKLIQRIQRGSPQKEKQVPVTE